MNDEQANSALMSGSTILSDVNCTERKGAPWYALYTSSRHEKVVAKQLEERQIETFLPLYRTWHRWKDRKKQLELPLFPGYVFVQMNSGNRVDLLRVPGVAYLVTFLGKPAPVAGAEIDILRRGLGSSVLQPHPYLKAGRKVRIRSGPMAGVEGIFVRRKDIVRVVLSISLIESSVAMEIDETDVEPIS
jgi:transcription antitermination factor NusG